MPGSNSTYVITFKLSFSRLETVLRGLQCPNRQYLKNGRKYGAQIFDGPKGRRCKKFDYGERTLEESSYNHGTQGTSRKQSRQRKQCPT